MTSFYDHLDPILNEAPLFCQVKGKFLGTVLNEHSINKWNDGIAAEWNNGKKEYWNGGKRCYGLTPCDLRLTTYDRNKVGGNALLLMSYAIRVLKPFYGDGRDEFLKLRITGKEGCFQSESCCSRRWR